MDNILKINNLSKKYNHHKVLNNLNMTIKKGAIYGLVGRNGAGKTTLIRIITGLQSPTNGYYELFNISSKTKKITEFRKDVGAIIERPSLIENMTAKENLIEQLKLVGIHQFNNVNNLLELVGLSNANKKQVKNFSLGMRQRMGIAVALCSNPKFIILDEPINGLDPEGIIDIRKLIQKLNKEQGITFLISSHYLDELSKIATDYGFINEGQIIKEISAKEFNSNKHNQIKITVDKSEIAEKYFKSKNIRYQNLNNNCFQMLTDINISTIIIELSKLNCIVKSFKENEDTLENYYLNLIGGKEND
ncbi:MAG: ATP-binding cassette domain-containing protein [Bacilli bacterium]|nr:ATP-binding cassette domain-containing protein [Bacilli bacterium]